MTTSRLIVLVSNSLYHGDKEEPLTKKGTELDNLVLGNTRLHVHRGSEELWGKGELLKNIAHYLSTCTETKVIVLAHLSTCFKDKGNQKAWQTRVRSEEAHMMQETKCSDLELWGFRHDYKSPAWKVLVAICDYISIRSLDPATAKQFDVELDRAFHQVTVQEAYEQVSLIRHNVLRPFLAAKINLEIYAERIEDGNDSSPQQILGTLMVKRDLAVKELRRELPYLYLIDAESARELSDKGTAIIDVLEGMPSINSPGSAATEFSAWLDFLGDSFDNLRNCFQGETNAKA